MEIDLTEYSLPSHYIRNNVKCFLDPARKKLIPITPEEKVRQRTISYLIKECKVPLKMIETEVPMCHFQKGAKGRADIIVYGTNKKEDCCEPALVIECKAPDITLVDRHYAQVYAYDKVLDADTIAITNGSDFIIENYDWDKENYQPLKKVPTYRNLVSKNGLEVDDSPAQVWKRPHFSKFNTPPLIKLFKDYQNIGEDTDKRFYPFIVNLAGFFEDQSWQMEPCVLNGIRIIADEGIRFTSFSNTGGSFSGDYRFFIIQDESGNNQIISLRVQGFPHLDKTHPRCPGQRGSTHIVVAIDDFEKSQWLLQVCIDKHVQVKGEKDYVIHHDCNLTCGAGAIKRSEVQDFIRSKAPELLNADGSVYLGTLDNTCAITWSQPQTREFIGRLIKYALLRDEFRDLKRKQGDGKKSNNSNRSLQN